MSGLGNFTPGEGAADLCIEKNSRVVDGICLDSHCVRLPIWSRHAHLTALLAQGLSITHYGEYGLPDSVAALRVYSQPNAGNLARLLFEGLPVWGQW
ncbi:MAG: hypothetical protein ACJ746_10470 [Bryobacteraceae bacterium]